MGAHVFGGIHITIISLSPDANVTRIIKMLGNLGLIFRVVAATSRGGEHSCDRETERRKQTFSSQASKASQNKSEVKIGGNTQSSQAC